MIGLGGGEGGGRPKLSSKQNYFYYAGLLCFPLSGPYQICTSVIREKLKGMVVLLMMVTGGSSSSQGQL